MAREPRLRARRWEGVAGVSYPEPAPRPASQGRAPRLRAGAAAPNAREWMSTAEAAEVLHVSAARVRMRLARLAVPSCRGQGLSLYWKRSSVLALAAGEARELLPAVPEGWLVVEEAVSLLGRGRSELQRRADAGRIRTRKVRLGKRWRCLYCRADVAELRALYARRAAITERINTRPS